MVTRDLKWSVVGAIWLETPTQPTGLTAYYSLADQKIGNLSLEFGLGDPNHPDWSTRTQADYAAGFNGAPYATDAGDLNGDGQAEVVLAGGTTRGDSYLSIFQNPNGSAASLAGPNTIDVGGPNSNVCAVKIVDVNGDGFNDIVVLNRGGPALNATSTLPAVSAQNSSLLVLLNDGHGNLTAQAPFALPSSQVYPSSPTSNITGVTWGAMAVGNVTGNVSASGLVLPGIVLVTNPPASANNPATLNRVMTVFADDTGTFHLRTQYTDGTTRVYILDLGDSMGAYPVGVAVGNVVNTSGVQDAVLLEKYADGQTDSVVMVLANHNIGNGYGAFIVPTTTFATSDGTNHTRTPTAIALSDLNGDGKPDVVTVSSTANPQDNPVVSILNGIPNGFHSPTTFLAGTGQVFALAIGDAGWSSTPQIILGNNTGTSAGNGVTVWRLAGTTWTAATTYNVSQPYSVALGTLTTGKTAILVGGRTSSTALTLTAIQNDTTFGIPQAYAGLTNFVEPAYDLTAAYNYLLNHPGTPENWYLKVTDANGSTDGWITDFQIRFNGQVWFTSDRDAVIQAGSPQGTIATVTSGVMSSITGTVYDDLNADGQRSVVPAVLESDPDTLPAPIPDTGAETMSSIRATGLTGVLTGVKVTLNITHPQSSDLVVKLRRHAADGSVIGSDILLLNHVGDGADFTDTVLDDQANLSLADGSSPYTGTFVPSGPLSALNGEDPNGWWDLIVQDTVPNGQVGQINSWSLELDTTLETGLAGWTVTLRSTDFGNTFVETTTTDALGNYSLTAVPTGGYSVTVTPAAGYVAATPALVVGQMTGETLTGRNFGFFLPVPIDGTVYGDTNHNGVQDSGEAGLAGVTVYLDANNDGRLDSGELTATTDATGNYSFPAVRPGTYQLRIVNTPGWVYSTPVGSTTFDTTGGDYPLTVLSGQTYTGQDFPTYEPALPNLTDGGAANQGFGLASNPLSTTINPGENFQINWRISNPGGPKGAAPAGPFTVSFYASPVASVSGTVEFEAWLTAKGYVPVLLTSAQRATLQATYDAEQGRYLLGTVSVSGLAAGGYTDVLCRGALPAIPVGDYYVAAVIDSGSAVVESDKTDNTAVDLNVDSHGAPVLLHVPGIRGTVWSDRNGNGIIDTHNPAQPNDDIPLAGRVVFLDGYKDGNTTHQVNGTLEWVDNNNDGRWEPGEGERWTTTDVNGNFSFTNDLVNGTYLLPPGTYHVAEVVPAGWAQTVPNTNTNLPAGESVISFPSLSGNEVTTSFAIKPGVDLQDEGPASSGFSPGTVYSPGSTFTAWCHVFNSGAGDAGRFTVSFYASRNPNLATAADNYLIGTVNVAGAPANSVVNVALSVAGFPLIPSGAYYVGYIIDSGNTVVETNETNNTAMMAAYPLVITNQPDLVEAPPNNGQLSATLVHAGDSWQATWTLQNLGGLSGPFTVLYYASDNATITSFDTLLGWVTVPGLASGASTQVQLPLINFPSLTPGQYYIGILLQTAGHQAQTNFVAVAPQTITVPGLTGTVYHDVNGDGTRSGEEEGLPGWRVRLYKDLSGSQVLDARDPLVATAVAQIDGTYFFTGLATGNYIIQENALLGKLGDVPGNDPAEAGWRQTGPTSRTYPLSVDANAVVTGLDFGNVMPSLLTGTVYSDDDGNGQQDLGELPVPHATIYLDDNNNGTLDAGELKVVTDKLGNYELRGVFPGNRIVREDLSQAAPDTYVSGPAAEFYVVKVTSAALYTPYHFGNAQYATIQGYLWNDLNGNGRLDPGEPMLQGWTVYLDNDGNFMLDPGEPTAITDAHGIFEFTHLHPGSYRVMQVVQAGWIQTWPDTARFIPNLDPLNEPRWHGVSVASGQTSAPVDYGNIKSATLSGTKWEDLDADGVHRPADPPLAGWTIQLFLDAYGSQVLSRGDMLWNVTNTDANGNYMFSVPTPGFPPGAIIPPNFWLPNDLFPGMPVTKQGYPTSYIINEKLPGAIEYKVTPDELHDFNGLSHNRINNAAVNGEVVQLFEDENGDGIVSPGDYFVAQTVTAPLTHPDIANNFVHNFGSPGWYYIPNEPALNVNPNNHNYILREFPISAWHQTAPAVGFYPQTVTSGQTVPSLDFGNYQAVTIGGIVYNDINGDGRAQPTEPGLANWTVFLDQNHNGILDPGEPFALTDSAGNYSFPNLRPGATYYVAEVPQIGWQNSQPAGGEYTTYLQSGQNNTAANFGNWQYGQISGTIFEDVNANHNWDYIDNNNNGVFDAGDTRTEGTLAGWQVSLYYDSNHNGVLDTNELATPYAHTTTDANGNYVFANLPVGLYQVSEVVPPNWLQEAPISGQVSPNVMAVAGSFDVMLTSGLVVTGLQFGDTGLATISGTVWNDINGDSIGPTQNAFTLPAASVPVPIPDNGSVDVPITVSGLNTNILHVSVTLNITHPYASDLEIWLIGPDGTSVLLLNRLQLGNANPGGENGQNFINTVLDDQASTSINVALAPFTGSFIPAQPLAGFDDKDPNGIWTLRIRDTRPADVGQLNSVALNIRSGQEEPGLAGWKVFLDQNNDNTLQWSDANHNGIWDPGEGEQWTTTDASGHYSFTGLTPGQTYHVAEVLQPGWLQSSPGGAGELTVPLLSQQVAANTNFGNVRAGSISGTAYEDLNLNGVKNSGEPALTGWQIALYYDSNHDGVLDNNELITPIAQIASTATGYQFTGLRPGLYQVSEYLQTGWVQEGPLDGSHGTGVTALGGSYTVLVTSGMAATGVDFGDARTGEIHGTVWQDLNANGLKDSTEGGLAGWTVYIDANNNGRLDPGEPFAITDAAGNYVLSNLPPRGSTAYRIREVSSPSMYPADPGLQSITVGEGQIVQNVNFGDWQYGSLSGTVWHDLNRNGLRDGTEEGLSGWVVFLDTNGDNTLDGHEPWTTTAADNPATAGVDESGAYSFTNLVPGTYTVVEVPQDGWAQTFPSQMGGATGAQVIQVVSGQNTASINFGDVEATAHITGTIRNDLNADAVAPRRQTFQPAAASLPVAIPDNSLIEQTIDVTGMPGNILDVNLTLNITHPNVSDLRVTLISPDGASVVLVNGIGGTGADFVSTVFDQAATASIDTATAPFTGTFRPHGDLRSLNGGNPNGNWVLRVEDLAAGNIGQLNGWSLSIRSAENEPGLSGWTVYLDSNSNGQQDSGERATTTDSHGNYSFNGLLPGNYRVGVVVPKYWTMTYPAGGFLTVTNLGVSQTADGNDFGAKTRPVANDSSPTIDENTVLNGSVTASDFDGYSLTYTAASQPAHGTLVLNADGTFTYTPDLYYNGTDQFTFNAADSIGRANPPGTVSITIRPVNQRPTATSLSEVTDENNAVTFNLEGLDVETPTSQLVFSTASGPSHGTLTINGGVATYTPATYFYGTDTFTYVVTDNGNPPGVGTSPALSSVPATVTITVNHVNQPPVADSQTLVEPTIGGSVGITLTGHDVETPLDQLVFAIATQPKYGNLVLVGRQATYTPAHNYAGQTDSFTFTVSDGSLTATGTISITVLPSQLSLDLVSGQSVSYVDGDGTHVRVLPVRTGAHLVFSGFTLSQQRVAGLFTVAGAGAWIQEMDLVSTNPGASLTVSTVGGDAVTPMGTLTGSAPLSRLLARGVNFTGGGIVMTGAGTVNTLQIGDLLNGAALTLPATAGGAPMSIVGGRFGNNSNVTLGRPVSALTLTQFDQGSFTAPSAAVIRTTGNARRSLPGDFLANMTLSGPATPATAPVLNAASIRGNAGGIWHITGRVNSVTVSRNLQDATITVTQPVDPLHYAVNVVNVLGMMDNVDLVTPGNINSIVTKAMTDTNVYAGVVAGTTGLPNPYTQINNPAQHVGTAAAAKISRLTIIGLPAFDPITRRITYSFVNSNIAAYDVGTLTLRNADPLADQPFGVATWHATRMVYTDSFDSHANWTWPSPRGLSAIPAGQFTVQMGMTGVESFLPSELVTRDRVGDSAQAGADIAATYMRVLGDYVYVGIALAQPLAQNVNANFRLDTNAGFGALADVNDILSDFQVAFNSAAGTVSVVTGVLTNGQRVVQTVPDVGASAVVTSGGILFKVPVSVFVGYDFFHLISTSLVSAAGQVLDRSPN
jgi:subtilisin-like proprotein convertase family protein